MIKYTVRCSAGHEFEGWFKDSAGFEALAKARKVDCPHCGDNKVSRAPMAPNISKMSHKAAEGQLRESAAAYMEAVEAVRTAVEETCDYVGDQFAEEARRIHYGESDERGIYGEATIDDAKALDDEGIDVYALPTTRREH